MNNIVKAVVYALPRGVTHWVGPAWPAYTETAETKIVENIVQGVVLCGLLIALVPYGIVFAAVVALVKLKNIVAFSIWPQ